MNYRYKTILGVLLFKNTIYQQLLILTNLDNEITLLNANLNCCLYPGIIMVFGVILNVDYTVFTSIISYFVN